MRCRDRDERPPAERRSRGGERGPKPGELGLKGASVYGVVRSKSTVGTSVTGSERGMVFMSKQGGTASAGSSLQWGGPFFV